MTCYRKFIKSHDKQLLFSLGAIFGSICFIVIYGADVLDFTNDAWIKNGWDLEQHYLGWRYLRKSAWSMPLGLIENITWPDKLSVIYTDSIPLFAIVFKIFSPVLPETFQYLGLFGIISYMLHGGVSAIILRSMTESRIICAMGSFFFILSPIVLQRMFYHTALANHFLLLMPMAIWYYREKFHGYKRNLLMWCGLMFLAPLVQSYFIGMVMILLTGYLLDYYITHGDWRLCLIVFVSSAAAGLLALAMFGGFYGDVSATSGVVTHLSVFNANLNALFNPQSYSLFLKALPHATPGQYEGFSYLGIGVLVLAFIALYILFGGRRGATQEKGGRRAAAFVTEHSTALCMTATAVVGFVLSLGTLLSLGENAVDLPYPDAVRSVWAIFRSTGRFIWITWYILVFFVLRVVIINTKQVFCATLIICAVALQAIDLSGALKARGDELEANTAYTSPLTSEAWDTLFTFHDYVLFLRSSWPILRDFHQLYDFSDLAYDYNMPISNFFTARPVGGKEEQIADHIANPRREALYVATDEEILTLASMGLNVYSIDGVIVGTAEFLDARSFPDVVVIG